jgi:outer membrane murein-binding lipoprotein Lpp
MKKKVHVLRMKSLKLLSVAVILVSLFLVSGCRPEEKNPELAVA